MKILHVDMDAFYASVEQRDRPELRGNAVMGAAGSDAAIETAVVAIMSDDLSKLPWLVHHSRRTLQIIRQNIAFSLSLKAVFALLTFFGFAYLGAAIAADMGASLLVISNGLRLLKPPATATRASSPSEN